MSRAASTAAKVTGRYLVSGATLVSRLSPMKRILCVCPAPPRQHRRRRNSDENHDERGTRRDFSVGFALSDPYLAHAFPVRENEHDHRRLQTRIKELLDSSSSSSDVRSFRTELLDELGFADVGAVAFALPMTTTTSSSKPPTSSSATTAEDREMRYLRGCLRELFSSAVTENDDKDDDKDGAGGVSSKRENTFLRKAIVRRHPFSLQCDVDQRVTVDEAKIMSEEEPDMWEEVCPIVVADDERVDPSVHAAVALNCFLWEHTGGWRNTFA